MKLVTFRNKDGQSRAGWLKDNGVTDMQLVSNGTLPDNMLAFIATTTVLTVISIAPAAGLNKIPCLYKIPAAKGNATTL